MTYQIAICDDEEKQRAYIKSLVEGWLRQTFHHTKIQEYASSEQFLFEQAYDRTQILFLDIEMEKMDGIALAREIRKHNRQMQIIFVTGYMEYIQEGYDVEALHYLLKPVSRGENRQCFRSGGRAFEDSGCRASRRKWRRSP